jgi:hypothetical protein
MVMPGNTITEQEASAVVRAKQPTAVTHIKRDGGRKSLWEWSRTWKMLEPVALAAIEV